LAGRKPVEYLDAEDLIDLARRLFGDAPPIRDVGLLSAAAARPEAEAFGNEAYPDLWHKAAAHLQSIVKNDALVDGNKRLGWLATAVFLHVNGVAAQRAANDDVFNLVMEVASRRQTVDEIASALRAIVPHR
jgi:death-on-curing protein